MGAARVPGQTADLRCKALAERGADAGGGPCRATGRANRSTRHNSEPCADAADGSAAFARAAAHSCVAARTGADTSTRAAQNTAGCNSCNAAPPRGGPFAWA